jgi:hypothetical protein
LDAHAIERAIKLCTLRGRRCRRRLQRCRAPPDSCDRRSGFHRSSVIVRCQAGRRPPSLHSAGGSRRARSWVQLRAAAPAHDNKPHRGRFRWSLPRFTSLSDGLNNKFLTKSTHGETYI